MSNKLQRYAGRGMARASASSLELAERAFQLLEQLSTC